MRANSTRAQLGQILSVQDLLPHVQQHIPRCTPDTLVLLLGYLHHVGTVLYFADTPSLRDIVVLDPQWFGVHVIGRVLAPAKDDLHDGELLVDPTNACVQYDAFVNVMTRPSKSAKYMAIPRKFLKHIVHMLEELQVRRGRWWLAWGCGNGGVCLFVGVFSWIYFFRGGGRGGQDSLCDE